LETLPEEEWKSGHGEMIKHSLISGLNWPEVLNLNSTSLFAAHLVQSIGVKLEVVKADFQEEGLRKILNLGHTFGHAWESFRASEDKPVTHGAAVIQGLHVALKLSDQEDLRKQLAEVYPWEPFENSCFDALWERMLGDKKNRDGVVLFVLLEELAAASWDNEITKEEWERALFELNAGWEPCLSY
jgi:3-dehydroquinate synthase